jgi:hypothetical protein
LAQPHTITLEVHFPVYEHSQEVVEQLRRLTCVVDATNGFYITLPPRSFQTLYRRTTTVESGPNCFAGDCESETERLEESHYVSYISLAAENGDSRTIHWTWQRKRRFSLDYCFLDRSVLSWRMVGGALDDPQEEEGRTGELPV